MKDTLYISDLDGTLLDRNAEVSEYTKKTLNELIIGGMNFSVATARTAATAYKILEDINVNIPVIVMNGACVYDLNENKYIKIEGITDRAKKCMFDILNEYNLTGFLYCINDDNLETYYQDENAPNAKSFIEERVRKYGKKFTLVNDVSEHLYENVVYYSVTEKEEKLWDAALKLSNIEGLNIELYRDVYNDGYWFLEICSDKASKYNAVNYLKKEYGFNRVVGFGDNLNDLSLFSACDESYAVSNAKPEVKEKSTAVIGSNIESGVACFLTERFDGYEI